MQTVILAGGEGTRLRPLTAETPKPLVKISGESAIERLLKGLRESGARSAAICSRYKAEKLKERLKSSKYGIRLGYFKEDYPLGTAGCVRSAWNGDDVMVLSGDGVCGFDFKAIAEFHYRSGADVTIVAREVDDPREYGLMTVDREGFVTGFIEKPGYDECITNLANTGAYVISKEIIKRIPEGENTDFARDVFPAILSEGKKLAAYIDKTYWYDIGDIPSLIKCQRETLEREGKPAYIDKEASVMGGAVVSGGSSVERGAAIGGGSRVISSIICEGACIAPNADICEAVVCENVAAGEGLIMKRFSALGEGCVVGRDVTIEQGARVAPKTKIPDGAIIRTDVSGGKFASLSFGDRGELCGAEDLREALSFAMAAGSALKLSAIAIGGDGPGAEALELGFREVGTAVYRLKNASFGETVFCSRRLECSHFIFVDGDIRLMSSASLELSRAEERKIEQAYRNRDFNTPERRAELLDGSAVSDVYLRAIKEVLPKEPKLNASVKTESLREAEIFSLLYAGGEGEKAAFTIASDRRTVSALTEGSVIPYESLIILCCKSRFEKKKSVVLPQRAPLSCDSLAAEYRCSAIRSGGVRQLSDFCCDPIELIFEVIRYVTERGISLSAAIDELPKVVYTKRIIEAPGGLPKLMSEGFSGARAGADVSVENGGARGFVRPLKSGRAVSVYIESVSTEAASELSADVARKLKAALDNSARL